MIMWEFMTGRRPFWNRSHDAELIIEIYDGLRPPIVTNAPEGYIELMKECWNSDPNKRPNATDIYKRIVRMRSNNCEIKKSSEISESITAGVDKRKFDDNQFENRFNEDYNTQEFELVNSEQCNIEESK
ncbi:kinase-like domain-containing protein [Rhizophagus irregularis DAOM 181602=DAOM 197198]|nr:kinase-like domain-containing protein [Rhizophagus irregularis DAOM 181602=DAOM 197198]